MYLTQVAKLQMEQRSKKRSKKTDKVLAIVQIGDRVGFDRVNGVREGDFNTDFKCILYVQLPGFTEGLEVDS